MGVQPDAVLARAQQSVDAGLLYRCLMCDALTEYRLDQEMFDRGGSLYNLAIKIHKKLDSTKLYSFPLQG